MLNIELKPCPFCRSGNVEVRFDEMKGFYVLCSECGVQVGYAQDILDISEIWNKRDGDYPEEQLPEIEEIFKAEKGSEG